MSASRPALAYMPQLDGLRGLAVAAVLVQHAVPTIGRSVPLARLGVVLFFVLSGYLITRLLLAARDRAEADGNWRGAFGRFYANRATRILPIYVLVVGLGLAIGVGAARSYWPYLVTFTTNWGMAIRGEWPDAYFHFWTLAVEEQFYLLWPLVILFGPRRWLPWLAGALVVIGPLFRGLAAAGGWHTVAIYCLTPACVDSLGAGALVALIGGRTGRRLAVGCTATAIAVLALAGGTWPKAVATDLAAAGLFAWAVHRAAGGFRGPGGWLLAIAPLRYLGRVSYGMYVYHVFLPPLALLVFEAVGLYDPKVGLTPSVIAMLGVVLIGTVVMSWHLLEKPLLELRRSGRSRVVSPTPAHSSTSLNGPPASAELTVVDLPSPKEEVTLVDVKPARASRREGVGR